MGRMQDSAVTDRSSSLRDAIDRVGYYPAVVADAVDAALAGESVVSYVIQHEPTFDRDEIRRHVTVLVLTQTRLLVTHTDEHPPDDVVPAPYASTTTEAVPLQRLGSVAVTRMVANPANDAGRGGSPGQPGHPGTPGVTEVVLAVGWGSVSRVDLEPATCGDPECEGDHGYTGMLSGEDFSLRVSSTADGAAAVDDLLEFAKALSAATVRS
jgi:uncharacterized protein DUF5998